MGCVNKSSKEFRALAKKNNVSENTLELITHKYWIETGNETLFPSDVYIQAQLGNTPYQESGKSVRKLWDMRYSVPTEYTTFEDLQSAKTEASKYFPQSAIVSYENTNGNYVLAVKQPIAQLNQTKEAFFNSYDNTNSVKNLLRELLTTRDWPFRTLSDEELKSRVIKALSEDYLNSPTNIQFAIGDATITYTPTGKQTQTYTIKGSQIFNKEGKEVFKDDSVDRNKIFANLAIQQHRAVVVNYRGTDYVVNNRGQIISTISGKIMKWGNENGDRKAILDLAEPKLEAFNPSEQQKSIVSQLIDHLTSMGLKVFGRDAMEQYLKDHNISSLQQATGFYGSGKGDPIYVNGNYRNEISEILDIVKTNKYNKPGTDAVTLDSENNKFIYLIDHSADKELEDNLKGGRDGFGIRKVYNIDKLTEDDVKEIIRNISPGYEFSTTRVLHILQNLGLTQEYLSVSYVDAQLQALIDSYVKVYGRDRSKWPVQGYGSRRYNNNSSRSGISVKGLLGKEGEEFLVTPQGTVYGFVDKEGNIYLDETTITSEHPIHEYTHLWDRAVQKNNPKLWQRGIALMQQTSLWNEIANHDNYGKQWQSMGISGDRLNSLIASEVHSRLTGKNGEEVLNNIAKEKGSSKLVNHLKQWIKDMWSAIKDTFSKWTDKDLSNLTEEQFINMTLRDFANGINPNNQKSIEDAINSISGETIRKDLSTIEQENNDYDLLYGKQQTEKKRSNATPQPFTFNDGTTIQAPFHPNTQQIDALNAMSDFVKSKETSMTLSGYAGTGKTSLMEILAKKMRKQHKSVIFCATTNKAAAVLNSKVSKSGFKANTLNKVFGISVEVDATKTYNAKNLVNVLKDVDIQSGTTIIIDEASMINGENYKILNDIAKQNNLKIIYVGDEAQLSPVNENNISKVFRNGEGKVVRLTQVERTDDNAILKEATDIRNGGNLSGVSSFNAEGKGIAYVSPQHQDTIESIITKFTKGLKDNPDYFRVLAYTNKAVADYNSKIRQFLGFTSPTPQKGEPMMGYSNWGYDFRSKSYRFINSESYKVIKTEKPRTISKQLADGTRVTLECIPVTLEDSLGNRDTFDYIDVKNNPQNRQAATLLASEKKTLWNKARQVAGRQAKAEIYKRINEIDQFLFVNDNIEDADHNTLQSKTIDFGYAMTVHKSQGSTFTNVLMDDVDISKASFGDNNSMPAVDLSEEDNASINFTANMDNASEEIDLGDLSQVETPSETNNLRRQLEYVAVSRATDTVTVISNNVKKEGSPLNTNDNTKQTKQSLESSKEEVKPSEPTPTVSSESTPSETIAQQPIEDVKETTPLTVSLPGYEYMNDLYEDTPVDAEWKIPYLKELDAQLTTELSEEQTNSILKQMDKILQATSKEEYQQDLKASKTKDVEKVQQDFNTLNNQYDNLIGEKARMCGLTATEVAHTAEIIVNTISDEITRLQTEKGLAQKLFPTLNTDLDFQTATRRKIVETVGLDRLLQRAKTLFSPKVAQYNDINTLIQAQLITENWDKFISLGAATFELNEGFGIKRDHKKSKFSETNENEKVDVDNFNGYENDEDNIAETEGKDEQEHWQIENRTIDNLQSMSTLVRQGLHQCYLLDENGNQILEKWSTKDRPIPKRVDPREAMNSILRWTQGSLSLQDMITRLSNKQPKNPWLSQLINRLSDTTGKETDFQSQFYGVFSKAFQPYSIVLLEDGTYKSVPVNDHPALQNVLRSITTLFKVGQNPLFSSNGKINAKLLGSDTTTSKGNSFNLHQALTELRNLNTRIKKNDSLAEDDYKVATDNIVGVCHTLGFYDVSSESLSGEITDSNIATVTKNLGTIVSILDNTLQAQNRGELTKYNPFDTSQANSINSALRNFLMPITDKMEDTAVNAFYDSGKMYQSYVTPSFLTKLMNKFRQEGQSFEDFLTTEYGSSEWFKAKGRFNVGWKNAWLRQLATSEEARKVFDHKVELNFNKHNYMRNMSSEEYTLSMIAEYFAELASDKQTLVPAWFRIPMQSNKPSSEFIKFYSYRGSDYKNEIIAGLHDMFLQELSRIQTVRMRNLSKSDPAFIKNFDTNGRKFCFLPILNNYLEDSTSAKSRRDILRNDDNTISQDNERLASLLQKKVDGATALSATEEAQLSNLVDKVLRQSMENRVQSILDKWENEGIITAATKVKNIYPSEAKYGKKLSEEEILAFTKNNIENFLWNDSFAAKNILQLTIGDIAFYKDAEDLQKRLAQLHAPGIRGNIHATDYNGNRVSDGKYRTFILKDFDNFRSNIIANISEVFDRKIAAAPDNQRPALRALKESLVGENGKYRNINVTDAQGYSSPSSYRKKSLMFGRWSQHAEDIYQRLLSGDYKYDDLQTAFQPLKPFVYSRINKDLGVDNAPIHTMQVPFQAKNAEYLLIMADAILQGEQLSRPNLLRAVYRAMEDSEKINPTMGIDTVQFESAIKSSLQGKIDITSWRDVEGGEEGAYNQIMNFIYNNESDSEGNRVYKNYNVNTYVHETSYEDYCLQQEVPEHFKNHSQAHGSQIRMIIPSDLDLYTTDVEGNQIDNFYEFDDYDADGIKTHKKLNANEFRKEYENTIAENIKESITKLQNDLHLFGSKQEKNAALSEILINEIESSPTRYGVDLIQACSLNANGEFRIPKGDPIQAKRIEQLINSIIKSRVNKQKIAGGPIVQVSNFGTSKQLHIRFNDHEGNLIPLEDDYIPSEHDNLSYKDYLKKNQGGIAYFEVFVPIWSNDLFDKFSNPDGTINVEAIEATDPELLKMISYRIPTEDKYSMRNVKAVGFMPREAGEAIMYPYEQTEIDDSDFDVDKGYVMRKDLVIKTKKRYEIESILFERVLDSYRKAHNGKADKQFIGEQVAIFLDNPQKMKTADDLMASINKEYQKVAYYTETPKSGRLYRDNKIIDMSYAVLSNQQTADKILNPGGFDAPKRMGYMVAAYKNPTNNLSWQELQTKSIDELKDLSYTDKDLTFADTQVQFYKQNSAAASLIGVFAVNKIAHATLEGNDILINIAEVCGENPFTIADFTFEGLMQVDPRADATGTLIGKTLGSLVSASADAVKDPILNLMNVNMTTAGMLNTMLRLGMTFDDAALFLSQNVIENVLNEFNRENLTNYQPLSKIIDKHIEEYRQKNSINETAAINSEPLSKEELIKGLTSEDHEKTDYKVLLAFQKLRSLTDAMKKPTYITRFNSISSAVGPLIVDNLIIEHKLQEFNALEAEDTTGFYDSYGSPVDMDSIFFDHPILKQFAKTVDIAASMFRDMPTGSKGFRNLLDKLPEDISAKMFGDKKLLDKFSTFYQSYLLVQSGLVNPSELKNYIDGFPEWFMSKQASHDGKTFKELYPENVLIQAIQRGIDKNGKQFLSTSITGKDERDKEKLRNAWIDLHYTNPELSQMLFNYSFFRGGIGFSPKTFMALVPSFVKENLKSKDGKASYIDTYRNFPQVVPELVIDQFIRNNWNISKLVPTKGGKNSHYNINTKSGRLEAYRPEDIADLSGCSYIKTKYGNNTYLWHLVSEAKDRIVYELIQPLGNNGEYLEISTSDIKKPLTNTTQSEEDMQEASELKTDSPVETDASENSKVDVVSNSEKAKKIDDFINAIMAKRESSGLSTSKLQAKNLFENMKSNPKKYNKFINNIFKQMDINVDEEKSNELFKELC